jgi:hypothetical protein
MAEASTIRTGISFFPDNFCCLVWCLKTYGVQLLQKITRGKHFFLGNGLFQNRNQLPLQGTVMPDCATPNLYGDMVGNILYGKIDRHF